MSIRILSILTASVIALGCATSAPVDDPAHEAGTDASFREHDASGMGARDADGPDAYDPGHHVGATGAWATIRSFTRLPLVFERSLTMVESSTHASMTDLHSLRRSFWEYPIGTLAPAPGYVLEKATLEFVVTGTDGIDVDLAFYEADASIRLDDFDRAGTVVATVEIDGDAHVVDVTSIVADAIARGGAIGIVARLHDETPPTPGWVHQGIVSSFVLDLSYEPAP